MEPQEAAPAEGAGDALFSDQIRLWLDEGDRLEAESGSAPMVGEPVDPGPFRRALRRLGRQVARHRMTVMAGFGLLPLALFAATHHAAPPPPVATVAAVAVAEPPPSSTAGPAPRAAPVEPPLAPTAPVTAAPAVLAGKVAARPAKLHHHHHHHRLAQRTNARHR